MNFETRLRDYIVRVEAGIARLTPPAHERPARLHEAMRYSIEAGGKRLRPVLCLAASELFPPALDPLPAAVAIECLHTYSLIHDDLPCMDNSDLRRGRPSCHRRFDEATALLAGDALLTHSFLLLAEAYADAPAIAASLVRELAVAAGSRRLIGGQMEDIEAEGRGDAEADIEFIHENKTGALISASLVMGGIVAGAGEKELHQLRLLGLHLGIAFQVVDDLLDAAGETATIGKTAGSDARNGKLTYPRLHGIARSREAATRHTTKAIETCGGLPGDTTFLIELIRGLERRAS